MRSMSFGFFRKSCSDAVITVLARSALVSRSRNWAMDFAFETSSTDFFWRSPYVDVLGAGVRRDERCGRGVVAGVGGLGGAEPLGVRQGRLLVLAGGGAAEPVDRRVERVVADGLVEGGEGEEVEVGLGLLRDAVHDEGAEQVHAGLTLGHRGGGLLPGAAEGVLLLVRAAGSPSTS